MTPEEPTQPPDEPAADDGDALDQDALDALIAGGGIDPPEAKPKRPPRLLDQGELDALLEATASKPPPKRASMPTGERPPIEREAIQDQGILEALLGPHYQDWQASRPETPSSSPPDGGKPDPLMSQEELDSFLEAEVNRPQAPQNAELPTGERPPIEKEEISDPKITRALMGPYYEGSAAPEKTGDSETDEDAGGAMSQGALDALLAGGLDAVPDEEGVEQTADTPEDDSSAAMDQEALDALLSAGISDDDNASPAGTEASPAATDQAGGLLEQADVEAMLEAQAAQPERPREDLPTGPRPRILKERIEDKEMLKALLGPDFDDYEVPVDDETGPTSTLAPLLDQTELDTLLANQKTEPREDQVIDPDAPRPEIEKEPITDPAVLALLMGTDAVSATDDAVDSEETDEAAMGQDAIDALLAGASDDEPAEEDEGPMGQDAIDALLAGASDDEPAEEDEVPMGQDAIDALLAGASDDEPAEEVEGPIGQDAVDALLAGASDDKPAEEDEGPIGQDAVDALLAEASDDEPSEEVEGPVGQDAVDALLAEASDEEPVEEVEGPVGQDAVDALLAEASDEEPIEEVEGPVGQDAVDALLAEASDNEPAEEDEGPVGQDAVDALLAEASDDEPAEEDEGPIGQDAVDALLAEASNDKPAEEVEGPIGQDAVDALLSSALAESVSADDTAQDPVLESEMKGLEAADEDSLLSDGGSEETLDDSDMEERLDGPDASSDQIIDGQSEVDALISEMATEEAQAPPAPPSTAAKGQVGGENVAAAGSTEAEDDDLLSQDLLANLLKDAQAEESGETAPAEEAAAPGAETPEPEPEPAKAGSKRPKFAIKLPAFTGALLTVVNNEFPRIAASLIMGSALGLGTFGFLSSHQMRSASEADLVNFSVEQSSNLDSAIISAREFMELGFFNDAAEVLGNALENAPPSPRANDAQYLRIEAMYRDLPQALTDRMTAPIHGEIDRALETARAHPRAPEALYWKARAYERSNNLPAARTAYRDIIEDFVDVPNMDEVLFAYGSLELETGSPELARRLFNDLLQQYRSSPLAAPARLKLGESLVALGETDEAREVFNRAAQAAPDTRLGAQAYERLGRIAFDAGNFSEAIDELEARLETATTIEGNDIINLLLAKAYRAEGRLEDARTILNELLDFFPETEVTPEAIVELSQVLRDLGNTEGAVRIATQAVQRFPTYIPGLRNAINLLGDAGYAPSAWRAVIAAHAMGVRDPQLLLAAGRYFQSNGAPGQAMEAYRILNREFADTTEALDGSIELATAEYAAGSIDESMSRLENLYSLTNGKPQRLPVLTAMAEIYQDLGLLTNARAVYEEIAGVTTDPTQIAQSAMALLDADALAEGLGVAARVDIASLDARMAYDFLVRQGDALLRVDQQRALAKMEQAFESYPGERTSEGNQQLLETYLGSGLTVRARIVVAELEAKAKRAPVESPALEKAATTWGDYLFDRRDYRAAADAYAKALGNAAVAFEGTAAPVVMSELQQWALYQRANALFNLNDLRGSADLFDRVAAMGSDWSDEAAAKARLARLELRRLRSDPGPGGQAG